MIACADLEKTLQKLENLSDDMAQLACMYLTESKLLSSHQLNQKGYICSIKILKRAVKLVISVHFVQLL